MIFIDEQEQGVDHLLGDQRPFLSMDRMVTHTATDGLIRVPSNDRVDQLIDADQDVEGVH